MTWISLSIFATLFFTAVVLFTKALTTYQLAPAVINFYFFFVTSLLFLAFGLYRGDSFVLPKQCYWLFGGLALVAVVYNDFFVRAVCAAPNAAYPQAILATNVIITALLAVFVFGADFHPVKLIGVALTALGAAMVCLIK